MDWKKVVLAIAFSLIAILQIQILGGLVALSLLVYMLVKGMDNCRIANLGLLLEFIGVLLYPIFLASQYGVLSGFDATGILEASTYIILIGAVLVMIGLIIVMLVFNKIKGNIYEA